MDRMIDQWNEEMDMITQNLMEAEIYIEESQLQVESIESRIAALETAK